MSAFSAWTQACVACSPSVGVPGVGACRGGVGAQSGQGPCYGPRAMFGHRSVGDGPVDAFSWRPLWDGRPLFRPSGRAFVRHSYLFCISCAGLCAAHPFELLCSVGPLSGSTPTGAARGGVREGRPHTITHSMSCIVIAVCCIVRSDIQNARCILAQARC